ncbi:ABC-2 transporter permease [Staphylococcus sp. 18_1_E_LY]|uniref:ABC-2 transporter permease n=1 Tax=Staphylococcus lloydii TaxID=2781774 RepID=A0A7T1B0B7_9STAP|nr:ABC-2 transporter permease [Staphylococcus lloydii]MBF7019992.1 ABC-2 transporter permease [Staphylococcus lloydii]MBF7027675.1 ABC-2 transporter permease [Staphylococcus lloydii]QPM75357.1 ABC-2 transporter permease [Staphylococcus lloydii]
MKGMLLSTYYASKKAVYLYLSIAILASIIFGFLNPIMSCFFPMLILISPVTDTIKHEKNSKWMNYISTLPVRRKDYINGYFTYYMLLVVVGLVVGLIVTAVLTQSIQVAIASVLLGLGGAGTYAVMFPLTFKFGAENSNVVLISSSIFVIALFYIVFFVFIVKDLNTTNSLTEAVSQPSSLIALIVYALVGILTIVLSYSSSIRIFNRQEL